jgi:hypothetical protein
MPERIQRKRTKGWKMPANTVYVGRPSKWGNPWTVEAAVKSGLFVPESAPKICVEEFAYWLKGVSDLTAEELGIWKTLEGRRAEILQSLEELRGKNLACWCKPGEPCHADVLLELSNK